MNDSQLIENLQIKNEKFITVLQEIMKSGSSFAELCIARNRARMILEETGDRYKKLTNN